MAKGGGAAGISGGAAVVSTAARGQTIGATLATGEDMRGTAVAEIDRATGTFRIRSGNRVIRRGSLGRSVRATTQRGITRVINDALRAAGIPVLRLP